MRSHDLNRLLDETYPGSPLPHRNISWKLSPYDDEEHDGVDAEHDL